MAKFLKWIGGGIGWAAGGPLGALMGFFFGSVLDDIVSGGVRFQTSFEPQGSRMTQSGDFVFSLLALSAAVMKSDNRVLKSELDFVKKFLVAQFGVNQAEQQLILLREILKQEIDLQAISIQVRQNMDYAERLQLLHYLFGISLADNLLHPSELNTIDMISQYLGIRLQDYESVKAMFVKDTSSAYKILEISPDATDEEVKQAYRKMALKYHPDRLGHLGEDVVKAANAKFSELNNAYEEIKRQRGIN
jgi:DnaJ like chaperone protein